MFDFFKKPSEPLMALEILVRNGFKQFRDNADFYVLKRGDTTVETYQKAEQRNVGGKLVWYYRKVV